MEGHPLTKPQLDELRQQLVRERDRIVEVLRGAAPIAGDEAPTDVEETAQRATETTHAADVAERERRLLGEVEQALARIDRGTFGVSEVTGQPIPFARLRAVPWTRRDVDE